MKTPHIPLRSPDLSLGASKNSCRAPKNGESRFISKRGLSWHDSDLHVEKRVKAPKQNKVSVAAQIAPVKLKKTPEGFKMSVRKNGKFGKPLIFSASLMKKLGNISQVEVTV